jgi:hypothetical protein
VLVGGVVKGGEAIEGEDIPIGKKQLFQTNRVIFGLD